MPRSVTILGAGLVGSLLSIVLRKRGYDVTVYERRPDMRTATGPAGRSINLAMSVRGWAALELAGLRKDIEELALPMSGRFLHQADGTTAFQPYGTRGEAIYSVSRGELNKRLMTVAEREGVRIHFGHRCNKVDLPTNTLEFEIEGADQTQVRATADLLIGADGAFSALRSAYVYQDRVSAAQHYIEHGYKELTIPSGADGNWLIAKDALHIWPRRAYMLIALPNTDGSFTCTLFMPFEGKDASFEALQDKDTVNTFFEREFPDVVALMPSLTHDFFANPTSSLITTHIQPWTFKDKSFLIGDAAHAIVPFYGQGMNAGFEDVRVLSELLEAHGEDWGTVLKEYGEMRKPAGDAVAALALQNFVEMRDKVADPLFLERKKVEKELARRYPQQFTSVYELVSFSHTPYHTALKCTEAQDRLWERIRTSGDFFANASDPGYTQQLESWIGEYHDSVRELEFGDSQH
jgi:kynurenine 3-monooxygenase